MVGTTEILCVPIVIPADSISSVTAGINQDVDLRILITGHNDRRSANLTSSIISRVQKFGLRVFFNDLRQNGLRINWGVVGCSIRTAAHGRSSPLSIAWVNPPERAGWFGLKDVTVGIDRNSLELSSPHLLGNAD